MTELERQIRRFILRALLAARGNPMTDETLKHAVRGAFQHIAFTASELDSHVRDCETDNLIAGTNDEVFGLMWALTPKGKIKAQQL